MINQNRYRYTKILVIISIICSFISFITISIGGAEIYPFSCFKLYTQPCGSKNSNTEYRIYSRAKLKEPFHRNPNHLTEIFDSDGYSYTFSYLIRKTLEDSLNHEGHKKKLLVFAKYVVPDQTEYKIVAETYHPLDLMKNPIPYDTATIITF